MSRGLGVVQRAMLEAVEAEPPGVGLLVGDGGWGYRRAARQLADRGLIRTRYVIDGGRRRLLVLAL